MVDDTPPVHQRLRSFPVKSGLVLFSEVFLGSYTLGFFLARTPSFDELTAHWKSHLCELSMGSL